MINLLENTYERINIKTHFKLHNYLNRHDIVVLCKNKILDYKSKISSKNENVSFLIDTASPNIKISKLIPSVFIDSYVIDGYCNLIDSIHTVCNTVHSIARDKGDIIVQIYCIYQVELNHKTDTRIYFNVFQRT